ncbi:helix-turn-helix domain-containing protein [Methanospirillum sp.]|uniref:helix-turn-helix domain-containing protein n=1 Tax=Methanospirillum sp. TaxID=45200 RepID=UPI002CDBD9A3|nr:helix-turn-helix domain-containing protein [Methanospirillum sp.]HOL40799.1 helix-turn-helix domain-containing protein [Methanospirillum sp.]HPP78620.1 helix-turn-helix domain-containing protein [Methanospirillum sp.]
MYRSYFHSFVYGGVQDVVVLDNMRKDLTISLDEEYINELLEIAEHQNTTLSALVRDIISSYIQSISKGVTPDFQDLTHSSGPSSGLTSPSADLSRMVARHEELIADLERRLCLLEGRAIRPPIQQPKTLFPDLIDLTSPAAGSSLPAVIDSDMPLPGNLAEEALVKVQKQPVAPVMDAMEMGSMKIRTDKEYSQTEAAVALGISVSTMRKYIKEKKITARKVGRSWLIHGRDILTYKASAQR